MSTQGTQQAPSPLLIPDSDQQQSDPLMIPLGLDGGDNSQQVQIPMRPPDDQAHEAAKTSLEKAGGDKPEPMKVPADNTAAAPQGQGGASPTVAQPPMPEQQAAPLIPQQENTADAHNAKMHLYDQTIEANKAKLLIPPDPNKPDEYLNRIAATHAYDAQLRLAKIDEQRQNPYGSPGNHPGFFGKVLHELGHPFAAMKQKLDSEAAGREEVGAEKTMETEQQIAGKNTPKTDDEQTFANGVHDKMTGDNGKPKIDPETKAPYSPYKAAIDTQREIAQAKEKPTNQTIPNLIAARTQEVQAAGGDPTNDPQILAMQKVEQGEKGGKETQEQNKLQFQGTVQKLAQNGLSTEPATLDKSLKQALANKLITNEEFGAAKGYQAANPNAATNLTVKVEGQQATQSMHNANNYYHWVDPQTGETKVGKGGQVPQGVEANPIGDEKAFGVYSNEATASNIVQQSLNRIRQDVDEHPEIFDKAGARNILATTLEQMDRQAAGILIAGTGGSVPLPSGLGDMINTALQNHALDKTTADAVKQYIADYKAMKDKVIVQQMEMQGGKIGRGSAQAFKAIADQIPNGATADSKTAHRQLDDLQQTSDELSKKYGNFGDYKKESVYQMKGAPVPVPKVGEKRGGYTFNGGDPNVQANWSK